MKSARDRQNKDYMIEELCCAKPNFDVKGGYKVCLNCGLIYDIHLVEIERRAYGKEEIEKRKQTEPRWREFGSRTVLPKDKIDYKGNYLSAEKKNLFLRLSKIQNSLISSIERNFWEAKPKLKQIASKINVPEYIHETAWKIYTLIAKKKLTMGRSIEGFIAASLYVAIRVHEFPKTLDELSDTSMIPRKTIIHSLSLVIREVLPELNLNYKPISVKQLIYKFGNELGLSMEIQNNALSLISKSSKMGLSVNGKDPRGFAASAIYLSARFSGEKLTQAKIAKATKITEVTLRTRIKDLKDKMKSFN
ncbi:MAG: transcription initiation factor IIB family protein [Candidatus Odinarchaeota archaeon]